MQSLSLQTPTTLFTYMRKKTKLLLYILLLSICLPTSANSLIWETDFSTEAEFNEWSIYDANADGNTWNFIVGEEPGNAVYNYHYTNPGDDWLISPAITPTETTQIMVKYSFFGSFYSEKMEVYFGNSPIPTSFTEIQAQHDDIKDEINEAYFFVEVEKGKPFHIAFRATSLPYKLRLALLSVQVYNVSSNVATEYPNRVHSKSQLVLAATTKYVVADDKEEIRFAVFHEGKDVTNDAMLFYLNDSGEPSKLDSPYYTCTEAGQHNFFATYGDVSSEDSPLCIKAFHNRPALLEDPYPSSNLFQRNALLIQGTGTRCVYCPNGISAIKDFYAEYPKANQVYHMALHAFTSDDPLYCDAAYILYRNTGLGGFPAVMVDFNKKWGTSGESVNGFKNFLNEHITEALNEEAQTAISAASTYNETTNTISVNVGVKTAQAGLFRVTVALLQDNVYALQSGTYDAEFDKHHSSVRAISPADGNGEMLDCGRCEESGRVYEYSCEFNVADLVQSSYGEYILDVLRDARILVYVQKMNGCVDNVVGCKINEAVSFEYTEDVTEEPSVGIECIDNNPSSQIIRTEIYDLSGAKQASIKGNLKNSDKSMTLPSGVYIIKEQTNIGTRTKKVILP